MLLQQRFDQIFEPAAHDRLELVKREVDAVVGDPTLRKIVGSDAFGAIATAHLQLPLTRLRLLALVLFGGPQLGFEQRHRAAAVFVLRAFVLALHHEAARQVRNAHRGVGFVDMLTAGARGAKGVDAQLRGVDVDVLDRIELGQDRHRHRRGVDATLRFGVGYPLHAVRAGLELQFRKYVRADHPANDLAEAAMLAGVFAEHLDLPAEPFGVAPVHAQQVAGKDCRLVAAGAGADFEIDIAVIARIGRDEHAPQHLFVVGEARAETAGFVLAERAHLRVGIALEAARRREFALEVAIKGVAFGERGEARVFHRELAKTLRAAIDRRIRQQPTHLFVAVGLLVEALADGVLHRAGAILTV